MIRKRHQSSLKLSDYQIRVIEEKSTWEVRTNDATHPYTISKLQSKCPYNCSICCPDCKVCVHEYMCTYPDAMIRTTICKHIYLIARYTASTTNSHHNGTTERSEPSLLKNLQNPAIISTIQELKQNMCTQLLNLAAQLDQVENVDTLTEVMCHINSAKNIIKARQTTEGFSQYLSTTNDPVNKHIEKQRPFHSTKRKRKKTAVRIAKPTISEKTSICYALLDSSRSLYGDVSKECNKPPTTDIISK